MRRTRVYRTEHFLFFYSEKDRVGEVYMDGDHRFDYLAYNVCGKTTRRMGEMPSWFKGPAQFPEVAAPTSIPRMHASFTSWCTEVPNVTICIVPADPEFLSGEPHIAKIAGRPYSPSEGVRLEIDAKSERYWDGEKAVSPPAKRPSLDEAVEFIENEALRVLMDE